MKIGPKEILLAEGISKKTFGIVTARWNSEITFALKKACKETLLAHNIPEEKIIEKKVPGAFELPLGAQYLIEFSNADAVICLGCLIKGETPHFHYISDAVTNELMRLSTRHSRPVVFGVLTVDTEEQALDRTGGKLGNKGEEAALAALEMLSLKLELRGSGSSIGFGGKLH